MLPTPETTVWSSRIRLIPEARRRTRRTNSSSSNSGSSGSRAMCAISGGSSAPPAETASPPNIRWSTNRSSRPGTVRPRTEAAPAGAARRVRRAAARASGRSCRGGRAGRRRCRGGARGTCRGGGRRRPRARSARAAKSSAPARCAADRPGVQHLDRGEPAADDVGLETAADDLDLGELGHEPGAVGRRRATGGPPPSSARSRGRPSRPPAARPPSSTGRRRGRRGSRRPCTCAVNVLAWSGPSSSMTYSGTPSECSARELLQARLPVQPGAQPGGRLHQRVEEQVHDVARRPRSRR